MLVESGERSEPWKRCHSVASDGVSDGISIVSMASMLPWMSFSSSSFSSSFFLLPCPPQLLPLFRSSSSSSPYASLLILRPFVSSLLRPPPFPPFTPSQVLTCPSLMYVPPSSENRVATKVGAFASERSCDLNVVKSAREAEMDLVRATSGGVFRSVVVIVLMRSDIGEDADVEQRGPKLTPCTREIGLVWKAKGEDKEKRRIVRRKV